MNIFHQKLFFSHCQKQNDDLKIKIVSDATTSPLGVNFREIESVCYSRQDMESNYLPFSDWIRKCDIHTQRNPAAF